MTRWCAGALVRWQDSQLLPGGEGVTDPQVRQAIALRRLRSTTHCAARDTAYYHRLFPDLRLITDELGLTSFRDIPITPKAASRGAPGDFVSRHSTPALMATTTGTSGTPTTMRFSRAELDVLSALNTIGLVLGCRAHAGPRGGLRRLFPGHCGIGPDGMPDSLPSHVAATPSGTWVAIHAGAIVGAGPTPGLARRDARRRGCPALPAIRQVRAN